MDNIAERQLILVMSCVDALNYQDFYDVAPGCQIVICDKEFSDNYKNNSWYNKLLKDNLLVSENVCSLNPCSEDSYFKLEQASQKMHLDYFLKFGQIISFLGAKSIKIDSVNTSDTYKQICNEFDLKVKGIGSSVDFSKQKSQMEKACTKLGWSFNTPKNVPMAIQKMKDFGLQRDSTLNILVDGVKDGQVNGELSYEIGMEQQVLEIFRIGLQVTPYKGINIREKFLSNRYIATSYKLSVIIDWGKNKVR